jgi:deoxyribodipyrimidine photo-lyase
VTRPVLVWFRDDLRLADNPALAVGNGVVPVYILDDEAAAGWRLGGAARWWLHHSLVSLGEGLGDLGLRLLMARGRSEEALDRWLAACDARAVFWN